MIRKNRHGKRNTRITKMNKKHGCRCGKKYGICNRYKELHHEKVQNKRRLITFCKKNEIHYKSYER